MYITKRVKDEWNQTPHENIKGILQEPKSSIIKFKVLEGVDERIMVVDTNKHVFKKEPFAKYIEAINEDKRVSHMGYMNRGYSKKAIVCILGVANNLIENDNMVWEAWNASMKKQVVDIMKKKSLREGNSISILREVACATTKRRPPVGESTCGATVVAHNILPLQRFHAPS